MRAGTSSGAMNSRSFVRTVRTGHGAMRTRRSATLPSSTLHAATPVRADHEEVDLGASGVVHDRVGR